MGFDLKAPSDAKKPADRVGGGGYVWDSNVYDCVIDMAYADQSAGGALGINITLVNNDRRLRDTLWATNKKKEVFYMDRNGDKQLLPGFVLADDLCQIAAGKDLHTCGTEAEPKTIDVYDPAQRKEVPMEKEVLTQLIGKTVKVAVAKVETNKRARKADGSYGPTNEKIVINDIRKFMYPDDGMTTSERNDSELEAADFINKWLEKNEGRVREQYKEVADEPVAKGGAKKASGKAAKQNKLFS